MVKQIEDRAGIFVGLSAKFSGNLDCALATGGTLYVKAESRARVIQSIPQLLMDGLNPSSSQAELLCIYDEVFADIVCSTYLAGSGLDKPAQMLLRRAFELGLAGVYLWDLPHVFWGWREHDKDLSFNDMIDHLSSAGYRTFVQKENPLYQGGELLDVSAAKSIYRHLSNIVHGKISHFESLLPDRFQYNEKDWHTHLARVLEVEELLIGLWRRRFSCIEVGLHEERLAERG